MYEPELLKLTNICGGAVEERFERALREVLENINDENTKPDIVREIKIAIRVKPFPDRKGALTSCTVSTKTAPDVELNGQIFFSTRGGAMKAYPNDPRQDKLFAAEPVATPQQ